MPLFSAFPTYERYRPLRLLSPILRGEDVYALQSALAGIGYTVGELDGYLGSNTARAISVFQSDRDLIVDGVAGPATQRRAVGVIAATPTILHKLPAGLLIGQLTHESGLFVGNFSPERADGSYDAGVAQRNTAHTPAREGFHVPKSVEALALNTRQFYDKFAGVIGRRRWELAAGAWNAPAFASYIAREEGATGVPVSTTARPGATARATFEAYMDSATALLK